MKTPTPPPLDVTLMNALSLLLGGIFALLVLTKLVVWLAQLPGLAIAGISVGGDVAHNNAVTLRANVVPALRGTFLTLDLARARGAFEALPWVRRAVVRREFPNRLRVQLQEHQPVAYWGDEDESRLVNSFGEVFEANSGEVENDALPTLSGPSGQAASVLAMYQSLQPQFERLELGLDKLELKAQGGWRAELDNAGVIELGSGSAAEVSDRLQRFLRTLTQVSSRYRRHIQALESADLRHQDGYALRLRGVSTNVADRGKNQN